MAVGLSTKHLEMLLFSWWIIMSFFFFALDGILNSKKIENKWEKITIGLQLIIFIPSLHEHKSQHGLNIDTLFCIYCTP